MDMHKLRLYLRKLLDILISGCSRQNIVKQIDVSTLCIHEKKKWELFCHKYAQVTRLLSFRHLSERCFLLGVLF